MARRQLKLTDPPKRPRRESKRVSDAKKKLKRHLQLKRQASKLYKESASLLAEAVEELGVNASIELRGGRTAVIVDNFARGTTMFKRVGCDRYAVEVLD